MTVSRNSPKRAIDLQESRIRLRIGERSYLLDPQRAFVFAHNLILKKEYENAATVLKAVVASNVEHPRPAILLAYCKAALKDYAASHDLLELSLPEDKRPVADRLHDAFAYHGLGVRTDTLQELVSLANEYKDMPTVCLILGDIFAEAQKMRQAALCWKLAVQRDGKEGAVAQAARDVLGRLKQKTA
ncbi:MAG: hypothetical protein IT426_00840 [Pirellulales bacterium]|nr:hypothetical protein [Pirellulales bacterium]